MQHEDGADRVRHGGSCDADGHRGYLVVVVHRVLRFIGSLRRRAVYLDATTVDVLDARLMHLDAKRDDERLDCTDYQDECVSVHHRFTCACHL